MTKEKANRPKKFESAGNDTIGGGFGLEAFGAQ